MVPRASSLVGPVALFSVLEVFCFVHSLSRRLAPDETMRIILRNGDERSLTVCRILELKLNRRKQTTSVWVATMEAQPRL